MATPPPPNVDSSRYSYLVDRLRTRRITMEEATELFALQQAMIRAAYQVRSAGKGIPPPQPPGPAPSPPTTSAQSAVASALFAPDDALMLGILALGAGAGLLAALAKHVREAPGSSASSTRSNDAE